MTAETNVRAVDPLGVYLQEIGEHPLLTGQQEVELSQQIEAGVAASARLEELEDYSLALELQEVAREGEEARQTFIKSNLRLVVSIAKHYPTTPSMELLDLIQEGNLGLQHAVGKFDWRKGFKFSTYATFWIRQAIGRALDQKTTLIRLPGAMASDVRRTMNDYGDDASGLPADVERIHRLTTPVSIDAPAGEEGSTLKDFIAYDGTDPAEESTDSVLAAKVLSELPPRESLAVKLRFGFYDDGKLHSYEEIAECLGLNNAEQARRLVIRTVRELNAKHARE